MDVRGPADRPDINKSSQVRREITRFEPAEPLPGLKSRQLTSQIESSEVLRLKSELKEYPEIREDVVTRTIDRLRSGELSTRESAESTAAALLNSINFESP